MTSLPQLPPPKLPAAVLAALTALAVLLNVALPSLTGWWQAGADVLLVVLAAFGIRGTNAAIADHAAASVAAARPAVENTTGTVQ